MDDIFCYTAFPRSFKVLLHRPILMFVFVYDSVTVIFILTFCFRNVVNFVMQLRCIISTDAGCISLHILSYLTLSYRWTSCTALASYMHI